MDSLRRSLSGDLFRCNRRLRHHQRNLRHHPIPLTLRLGLSLYRLHVPRPNLLRPSPLRRQCPRNAPRRLRRPRLLNSSIGNFGQQGKIASGPSYSPLAPSPPVLLARLPLRTVPRSSPFPSVRGNIASPPNRPRTGSPLLPLRTRR